MSFVVTSSLAVAKFDPIGLVLSNFSYRYDNGIIRQDRLLEFARLTRYGKLQILFRSFKTPILEPED